MSKVKLKELAQGLLRSFRGNRNVHGGAAIAQWSRLRLPFCRPWLECQAHHLHFYHTIVVNMCYICHVKRTKKNKKRPDLADLKNVHGDCLGLG